jgi:hypothetical protein
MLMMKTLIFLLGVLSMSNLAFAQEFEVGQIWKYETRLNEIDSTFTIVKIDDINGKRVIHISLSGLKIKSPQAPNGYSDIISHMPFAEEALKEFVVELVGIADELPDFEEGYDQWKEAADKGEAGWFTISIAEAIQVIEDTIN